MSALHNVIAASSGAAGAAFSTVLLYPIEVVKTRVNKGKDANGVKYTGPSDVIKRVLAECGLQGFYKGMSTRTTHQIVQKFSFYYSYDFTQSLYKYFMQVKGLTFGPNLLVGYVAGVWSVMFANPLEVASTRQICQGDRETTGTLAVMAKIAKEGGLRAFYRGSIPNLVLAINPAIENTLFDQLGTWFKRRRNKKALSIAEVFWLGALAKYIATFLTFPYIRAKVIIQAGEKKGALQDGATVDPNGSGPQTTAGVLSRICREDGFNALWAGMTPQAIKAVLSSAVLMTAKNRIEILVRTAILSLTRDK